MDFLQRCNINLTNSLDSVEKNKPYAVINLERVQTRFGWALVATIKNIDRAVMKVYLPQRFTTIFDDEYVKGYNETINTTEGQRILEYFFAPPDAQPPRSDLDPKHWPLTVTYLGRVGLAHNVEMNYIAM